MNIQLKPNYDDNLRKTLTTRFNVAELRDLCFALGLNYDDDLGGNTKNEKAMALISYCKRRGWIEKLIETGKQRRSDISWDTIQLKTLGPQNTSSHFQQKSLLLDVYDGRRNILTFHSGYESLFDDSKTKGGKPPLTIKFEGCDYLINKPLDRVTLQIINNGQADIEPEDFKDQPLILDFQEKIQIVGIVPDSNNPDCVQVTHHHGNEISIIPQKAWKTGNIVRFQVYMERDGKKSIPNIKEEVIGDISIRKKKISSSFVWYTRRISIVFAISLGVIYLLGLAIEAIISVFSNPAPAWDVIVAIFIIEIILALFLIPTYVPRIKKQIQEWQRNREREK